LVSGGQHARQPRRRIGHRFGVSLGALGRDGYQQNPSPVGVVLQAAGKPYGFQRGTLYDLDANDVICSDLSAFSGAHSDIRHPEIQWAARLAAGLGG
jgi:hypothetical protein